MAYRYSDEEIKRISGAYLTFGEPVNRNNAKHLPELVRHAENELQKALKSRKAELIAQAQDVLDTRKEKLRAYSIAFPK